MSTSLEHAVVTNAAGMVKTQAQAEALLSSAVTRITIGSITPLPRPGNIGETYFFHPERKTAWNAKGMDNPGADATLRWLPQFRIRANNMGKKVAISIAGFSPDEYAGLADSFKDSVDCLELNMGCGNIYGPDGQKPIPSYHPPLFDEILTKVWVGVRGRARISVKVSPVGDTGLFEEMAKVIRKRRFVKEVVAVNTLPNQSHMLPGGAPALAFRESEDAELRYQGGMSGARLRNEGLFAVQELRRYLPDDVRIIGCGGIFEGEDAVDYLDTGADGFAIGTAFFEHGSHIFSEVLTQAAERIAGS